MADPRITVQSCDPRVLEQNHFKADSPEAVVAQAKLSYAGYEELVDEYVCYDPSSRTYYLDQSRLESKVRWAMGTAQAKLECDVNPTKECKTLEQLEDNFEQVKTARESYERHLRELGDIGAELQTLDADAPEVKLLSAAGGGMVFGLGLGVGYQFLSHGPLEDLQSILTKQKQWLQELYVRNQVNLRYNSEEYAKHRDKLKACGFRVSRLTPELSRKLSFHLMSAMAGLTALTTAIGYASYSYLSSNPEVKPEIPASEITEEGAGIDLSDTATPEAVHLDREIDELDSQLAQGLAQLAILQKKEALTGEMERVLDKIMRRLNAGDYEKAREVYENEFLTLQEQEFLDPITFEIYSEINVQLENVFNLYPWQIWLRQNRTAATVVAGGTALTLGVLGPSLLQGESQMQWMYSWYKGSPFRAGVDDIWADLNGKVDSILEEAVLRAQGGMSCVEDELMIREVLGQSLLDGVEEGAQVAEPVATPQSGVVVPAPPVQDPESAKAADASSVASYSPGILPAPTMNLGSVSVPKVRVTYPEIPTIRFNNPLVPQPAYAYAIARGSNGVYAPGPYSFAESSPILEISYAARSADVSPRFAEWHARAYPGESLPAGVAPKPPAVGGGVLNLNTAGQFVAGSAIFLGVGYAGDKAMDYFGVPQDLQSGIGTAYTVGGLGYGLHVGGAQELAVARNASLTPLTGAQTAAAYGRGVSYMGGGMIVGYGTGDLAAAGTSVLTSELGFSEETSGYLETGASLAGGIGGGAAFVTGVAYLGLSTPVTAVAALGILGACELGSYFLREYEKGRALERAEENFRGHFSEMAGKEPDKKWDEILGIFDEMKSFCENELNTSFGYKDVDVLKKMVSSPNYKVVSAMMGWWFHEKYFKPFLETSTANLYLDQIKPLFLDLKFPGLNGIVGEFKSHLTLDMDSDDIRALDAIVADRENVMLFDYAGQYVVEEVLDPFLFGIGYYEGSYFGQAYDWVTTSSEDIAKKEKVLEEYGFDVSMIKYNIENPHAQPHIAEQEMAEYRAQQKVEYFETVKNHSDPEAIESYRAELESSVAAGELTLDQAGNEMYRAVTSREFMKTVALPTQAQREFYQQRSAEVYKSLLAPFLTWTGSYSSSFFTEFPKAIATQIASWNGEGIGGYDGAAWMKFYLLKQTFEALKAYLANLRTEYDPSFTSYLGNSMVSGAYQAWYGDFSNDEDIVAGILEDQIEERFKEFENERFPDQIDGIAGDIYDLFETLSD